MVVTSFNLPMGAFTIINCYLPSGNKSEAIATFADDIDCSHVLVEQLEKTSDVLIIGDLKQDHYHRGTIKECMIKELIRAHNLTPLSKSISEEHTYINYDLGHYSHIDHA